MAGSKIKIDCRNKDYTMDATLSRLPANDEQLAAAISLFDMIKERPDVSAVIHRKDEEQADNVPQSILIADSPDGIYMELSYDMDDFGWSHPLILANDHLSREEAEEVLVSILRECTDQIEIINSGFGEISSTLFPEDERELPNEGEEPFVSLDDEPIEIDRPKREDLEGGTLLKSAVHVYVEDTILRNILTVLVILRDSYVWIPCTAVFSDADQKMINEMASGDLEELLEKGFTTEDPVRMVPDILQKGDDLFFPIFSSAEEMGEYGDGFSKVEKHMLEALVLARNNEKKPVGIVLNAFSEPFVIGKEVWDFIEQMESHID